MPIFFVKLQGKLKAVFRCLSYSISFVLTFKPHHTNHQTSEKSRQSCRWALCKYIRNNLNKIPRSTNNHGITCYLDDFKMLAVFMSGCEYKLHPAFRIRASLVISCRVNWVFCMAGGNGVVNLICEVISIWILANISRTSNNYYITNIKTLLGRV